MRPAFPDAILRTAYMRHLGRRAVAIETVALRPSSGRSIAALPLGDSRVQRFERKYTRAAEPFELVEVGEQRYAVPLGIDDVPAAEPR